MGQCWAKALGDCRDSISREHIVSEGMYRDQMMFVSGLPWCLNEPKQISTSSFTKKILCRAHNSALADVDQAGIDALSTFREDARVFDVRTRLAPRQWTVKHFHIDGRGLERWFLKTLINVAAESELKIGADSDVAGQPSERLVRVAFGKEPFRGQAGLYGLVEIGEGWNIADGVHIMMLGNQQLVNGALFRLHGYRFVLFLGEEGLPSTITAPALDGQPEHAARTLFPLMAVRRTIGDKYLSQVIHFDY